MSLFYSVCLFYLVIITVILLTDIPDGDMTVRCGKLHINIKNADINKEPSHAIVNIMRAGFHEGEGNVYHSHSCRLFTNLFHFF